MGIHLLLGAIDDVLELLEIVESVYRNMSELRWMVQNLSSLSLSLYSVLLEAEYNSPSLPIVLGKPFSCRLAGGLCKSLGTGQSISDCGETVVTLPS